MKLTDQELLTKAEEIYKTIRKRSKTNLPEFKFETVQLFQQDNFTSVLLNNRFHGVAKRNPSDAVSNAGVYLALRRALSRAVQEAQARAACS
jgi:hypothetical protein